jgi:4-amino-4-deoxy-L-arabinose transferase-like glycosyltransferase
MRSTDRIHLLQIILLALLLRSSLLLVACRYPERMIRRDTTEYLQLATNLVQGKGFSQKQLPPYQPDVVHTPVYPVFLAMIEAVIGNSLIAIAIVQVVLSSLTAGLVYLLGRQLFNPGEAFLAALFYAVSLESITHAIFLLTETLFTVLLLIGFGLLIHYQLKRRLRWLLSAGLVLGLAILCRPIALYYPLLAGMWVAIDSTYPLRARLYRILVFLFVCLLIVGPWLARNQRLVGKPVISIISSYNLYFYNSAALLANLEGISERQVRADLFVRAERDLSELGWKGNPGLEMRYYQQKASQMILAHPLRYAFVHLKGDIGSLLPNVNELTELLGYTHAAQGTLSVLNQQGIIAAVYHYYGDQLWLVWALLPFIILLAAVYLGAVAGIIAMLRRRKGSEWFLFGLTIAYFLLLPGAPSNPRFRVPVMPLICLLAGPGWWLLREYSLRVWKLLRGRQSHFFIQ